MINTNFQSDYESRVTLGIEGILQYERPCRENDSVNNMIQDRCDGIGTKASRWQGAHRFANVAAIISLRDHRTGLFIHTNCLYQNVWEAQASQEKERKA